MVYLKLSPAIYRLAAALLFTTLGAVLHSSSVAPKPTVAAQENCLEAQVSRALDDTLGPESYRLYLVVDRRSTLTVRETLEVGDSVVVSEQSKKENYSKPDDSILESDEKNQYALDVTSRNYLVGQTETTTYLNESGISGIRCVVRVSDTAWAKVPSAESLLTALLDLPVDQRHRLSFQQGLDD